jgi:hypothetical protein
MNTERLLKFTLLNMRILSHGVNHSPGGKAERGVLQNPPDPSCCRPAGKPALFFRKGFDEKLLL